MARPRMKKGNGPLQLHQVTLSCFTVMHPEAGSGLLKFRIVTEDKYGKKRASVKKIFDEASGKQEGSLRLGSAKLRQMLSEHDLWVRSLKMRQLGIPTIFTPLSARFVLRGPLR